MSTAKRSPAPKRIAAADDTPFDFNLDAVESEVELRPFRIHYRGKRWEMEHLEALDVWDLVEAADGGDVSAMIGAFRAALGDQFDAFRALGLPQYKLKPFFAAYREHCGHREGESEASADS